MRSHILFWSLGVLIAGLLVGAFLLASHAWRALRVPPADTLQRMNPNQAMQWLDLQIEDARKKMTSLDPGTPPPWYAPAYYYDWLPRARLYAEAHDALRGLQHQKRRLLEEGRIAAEHGRGLWNAGLAPLLHFALALSLGLLSLRLAL